MKKIIKLVTHPVKFFEDAEKKKKLKEGKPKIYVIGFSTWKTYLRKYFSDYDLIFIAKDISQSEFNSKYRNQITYLKNSCQVFIWGFKAPDFVLEFLKRENVNTKFVEDGFIRSIQLGATKAPPMSLCIDSKTPYFDATQPSELEHLLSTFDFSADSALLDRAKKGMELLLKTGVSKYNNSSPVVISKLYGKKNGKRVLVLGQVEDDASIAFGCQKKITNNDLVRLAVSENPGAEVIYKPHPDVLSGYRSCQSDPRDVANICRLLTIDIPLANAFESIDHVYTITSLGGFEAVLRGIEVTVLGCPFYAGWGLTDDRQPNNRRIRHLALEEIFAIVYLVYPKYFDTETGACIAFEEVVERIISQVSFVNDSNLNQGKDLQYISYEKSAINQLVKMGYEKYGDNWDDYNAPIAFLFFFQGWRLPQMPSFLNGFRLIFKPVNIKDKDCREAEIISKIVSLNVESEVVVWGMYKLFDIEKSLIETGKRLIRVEEGFIRGVGLGANLAPPLSMAIDHVGMYFDSRSPSLLENLLNNYDFSKDHQLLLRSRDCINKLLEKDISKYNFVSGGGAGYYGEKHRKRVLVLGQVEDDQSIKYGCKKPIDNNGLVMIAALENPDADIYYKPHPDTLRGNRRLLSDPKDVESICKVIYDAIPLSVAFNDVDHVYTITSLSGFEALLRGIKVTTFGAPFYSGWGVTDDRQSVTRRKRNLKIEEIFAAAYILYMQYRHPISGEPIEIEDAISIMEWVRNNDINLIPKFYENSDVGNRYFSVAKKKLLKGDYAEALNEINKAIKLNGSDHRYYQTRIEIFQIVGCKLDLIKNDFYSLINLAPDNKKLSCLKSFINYIWKTEGVTKELRGLVSSLQALKVNLKGDEYAWLAAIYCDAGYYSKAVDYFKRACEKDRLVVRRNSYLALSNLVIKFEPELIPNRDLIRAIYKKIDISKGAFEAMVKTAGSIAVVGNSPKEIGRGAGSYIDNHDIVIRFNNFSVDSEFQDDYGKKTDIWIHAGYFDEVSRRNTDGFKLVVQPVGDILYRDPKGVFYVMDYIESRTKIDFLDRTVSYELYNLLGAVPSSGIKTLYSIYKIRGKIPKSSVFGFSFVDQNNKSTNYTNRQKSGQFFHNWKGELEIFNRIVG